MDDKDCYYFWLGVEGENPDILVDDEPSSDDSYWESLKGFLFKGV